MPTAQEQTRAWYVGKAQFTTTHWSVVLAATQGGTTQSSQALELLCRTYWFPLYAFVRRRGYAEHEAQDLTQEFFARLLEKEYLRGVGREKGKFRSFLLAALEHFLANEWRRTQTQKRGGGASFLPLEEESNGLTNLVVSSNLSPEEFYDQQWAIALLEQAVGRVQQEYRAAGKGALFDDLKNFLTGEKRPETYAELASKLEMTEAALKMAVSRMRHRYRELLFSEIASTVSSPEEVEEELHALFAALHR